MTPIDGGYLPVSLSLRPVEYQTPPPPSPMSKHLSLIAFILVLLGHLWVATIGWENRNLPGMEFRQAQTGLSTYFIQKEDNFSLAYPTPVLGKPWSIPMEFPLYQWTVVVVSNAFDTELTQSARAVSLFCFYLTLPALALFLRRIGMVPSERHWVLIITLSCPLYIFYSRAFLIETMALMFAAWFVVAYIEALVTRRWAWFIGASLFGVLAGAVKVTTFAIYLVPCAVWTAWLIVGAIRGGRPREWLKIVYWGGGAVLLPGLTTIGWTHYADAVKALNPQGYGLTSTALTSYNIGSWTDRISGDIWRNIASITNEGVMAGGAALLVLLVGIIWGGRWRWPALAAGGCYLLGPLLFPQLYARHDYYFVANSLPLMLAAGFVAVGLSQSLRHKWTVYLFVAGFTCLQALAYHTHYFAFQSLRGANGPKLALTLRDLIREDEVLVIVGDDWNSMIPYYAQRRALMFLGANEHRPELLNASIDNLRDEKVGALVLMNHEKFNHDIVALAARKLGIAPSHFIVGGNAHIYLHRDILEGMALEIASSTEVVELSIKDISSSEILGGRTWRMQDIPQRLKRLFQFMTPTPDEVFFQFGPGLSEYKDMIVLNANAVTQLWFDVPENASTIFIRGGLRDGAWQLEQYGSDGITLSVSTISDAEEILFSNDLNPKAIETDRGLQNWEIPLGDNPPKRVLIEVGPGPHGSGSADWFYFTSVEIR